MANCQHLDFMTQGSKIWNRWREQARNVEEPDLSGAELSGIDLRNADLHGVNFMEANLRGAKLSWSNLYQANLRKADLRYAKLRETDFSQANLAWANLQDSTLRQTCLKGANLSWSNLKEATLREVNLQGARLQNADLRSANLRDSDLSHASLKEAYLSNADFINIDFNGANLQEADLRGAHFLKVSLKGTNLSGCRIYGIAVWDIDLNEATNQQNLVVTDWDEPSVSLDNFHIAQFMYLLLHTPQITQIFEAVTSRFVLIIGHFTPERNPVSEALRAELRKHQYIPLLLDIQKPDAAPFMDMLSILAHISRFMLVDVTAPRLILESVENLIQHTTAPLQPLFLSATPEEQEPPMLASLRAQYPTVLKTYRYAAHEQLSNEFDSHILSPVRRKLTLKML